MNPLGKTGLNVMPIGFGGIVVMDAEPQQASKAVADWETGMRLSGPEAVKAVQQLLINEGHYSGAVDGIQSEATHAALVAYANSLL